MLRSFLRAAALATTLSAVPFAAVPSAAQAQSLTPQQRGEVETVLRDYLKRNPEFLI